MRAAAEGEEEEAGAGRKDITSGVEGNLGNK